MNKGVTLLSIFSIIGVLIVSGCTGKTTYSSEAEISSEQPKEEAKIESSAPQTIGDIYAISKNWDSYAEVDGLEFTLYPKGKNDEPIKAEGTVSAIIYKTETSYTAEGFETLKGEKIQEWKNIPVKKADYGLIGTTIRLEYKDFVPKKYETGWLEITFTTSDGKSFSTKQESVFLG